MNALRFAGLMAGLAGSFAAFSQTGKTPTFEVASIRPASFLQVRARARVEAAQARTRIDAAGLSLPFISLSDLLPYAFQVKDYQVVAPGWTRRIEVDDFGEASRRRIAGSGAGDSTVPVGRPA